MEPTTYHVRIRCSYFIAEMHSLALTKVLLKLCNMLISSFLVDDTPIRVYENQESIGVPFPKNQPMRLYSSLWNADQWATRGGLVKADWSEAPFTAYYRNFNANACIWSSGSSSCSSKTSSSITNNDWQTQGLNASGRRSLRWVQKYYMIYNYCTDYKRFPLGRPRECRLSKHF